MDGVWKSLGSSTRVSSMRPASNRKGGAKEIFERGRRRDEGPTMVPTSEISDVISNPFLRYFINVASDVSTKE